MMPKNSFFFKVLSIIAIITLFATVYLTIIRPWHMRWGATDEEIARDAELFDRVEASIPDSLKHITG